MRRPACWAIPFRDLPNRGRLELEALVVPRGKLTAWLESARRGRPSVSRGIRHGQSDRRPSLRLSVRTPRHAHPAGRTSRRGRASSSSYASCVTPTPIGRKWLAYEAWQLARREFSEAELPSVATIQRSMVEILGSGSGVGRDRSRNHASSPTARCPVRMPDGAALLARPPPGLDPMFSMLEGQRRSSGATIDRSLPGRAASPQMANMGSCRLVLSTPAIHGKPRQSLHPSSSTDYRMSSAIS